MRSPKPTGRRAAFREPIGRPLGFPGFPSETGSPVFGLYFQGGSFRGQPLRRELVWIYSIHAKRFVIALDSLADCDADVASVLSGVGLRRAALAAIQQDVPAADTRRNS